MRWSLLVVLAWIANSGCTSGECGEGTMRHGDKCVLVDPFDKTPPQIELDPPLHTREVGIVRLKANEPATIYYTIDGSEPTLESSNEPDQVVISSVPDDAQLRYFAVDLAGNRSDEESRVWIIDREGPAAPLDFKVALSGSTRTVTWMPPPDPRFGGVLVARVEGSLASPISGDKYEVGATLAPGVTIVNIATAAMGTTSIMETLAPTPGMVRYVAWAYDNLYNYGPPAGDFVLVPIPPQTGRLEIKGNGTVTVMLPASNLTFSGSATLAGSTLTAKITMKNETSRVLFAPKVLVTNNVPSWSNSTGTFETYPYRAYGAAILPGGSTSATWTFTGASASTTISLDFDVRNNYVMTASTWDSTTAGQVVDFATGEEVLLLQPGPTGQGGDAMTKGGGITPDGRLVVGARTTGTVSVFDLSTGKRLLGATLRAQKANVPHVLVDRGGAAAYAIVQEGHPQSTNNNGGSNSTLVRLDAATLQESGRLPLDVSRNRDINISKDGRTLLIATGITQKGVIVVDLTTFTIKTRIMTGFRTQNALFAPDGSIVAVGEQVAVYNTEGVRQSIWTTPGTNGKVLRAAFSSPNILWIGRRGESGTIDIRDGTSQLFTTLQGRMLDFFDGKIYTSNGSSMNRVNLDGTIETTLPGFGNLDGHWIGRSPF